MAESASATRSGQEVLKTIGIRDTGGSGALYVTVGNENAHMQTIAPSN
jgi:hypothetical protein